MAQAHHTELSTVPTKCLITLPFNVFFYVAQLVPGMPHSCIDVYL